MWEAIVEKLLTRYLSEYVDGIEREKLQVGLLSGDIELTDLTLKPEAADALGLAFSVVFGRIGRLSISVSWTKWMAQKYDLRVTVEHVHILLKPRIPETTKSTTVLREELRQAKELQISRKENIFMEGLRGKEESTETTENASFLMKITNRLIQNIEIEVKDIHIAFHDASRGFSLGCLLDVGSLFSCNSLGERIPYTFSSERSVSKSVQLRGLSMYVGTTHLPEWKDLMEIPKDDIHQLRLKASQFLFSMQGSLPRIYEKIHTTSGSGLHYTRQSQSNITLNREMGNLSSMDNLQSFPGLCPAEAESSPNLTQLVEPLSTVSSGHITPTNQKNENGNPLHSLGFNYMEQKKDNSSAFDYVLLPLHLAFYFTSTLETKEVTIRLLIGEQSRGIMMGRSQVKTALDLWQEATEYRKSCHRLLMARSHIVRLDAEGLQTITRPLFCNLYSKKLQYDLNIPGHRGPLTPAENERLLLFHDVISIRHLAKWRAACLLDVEKILQANASRVEAELAEARKQQSWWGWATQGPKVLEASVLEKLQETDNTLLTEAETKFMSDVVMTEISVDSYDIPTTFRLSFSLPHFTILLHEDSKNASRLYDMSSVTQLHKDNSYCSNEATHNSDLHCHAKPFIVMNFTNVQAKLFLKSCIDRYDKEVYEWTWSFLMSDFSIRHRGDIVVSFCDYTKSVHPSGIHTFILEHQHSSAVSEWLKPDPITEKTMVDACATLWEFQHIVEHTGNILSAFIRMSPLEIIVHPDLVWDILTFFIFQSRRHVLLESTTNQSACPLGVNTSVDDSEQEEGEFYEGFVENAQRLHAAATENSPDLLKLDIVLCAPILYCNSFEGSGVVIHFGFLKIKTKELCSYSQIELLIDMNETQITCLSSSGERIPILRPIPIEFQLKYDPANYSCSLDIVFYELFIEINPEAMFILFAVLSSMTKSLAKVRPTKPLASFQHTVIDSSFELSVPNQQCFNPLIIEPTDPIQHPSTFDTHSDHLIDSISQPNKSLVPLIDITENPTYINFQISLKCFIHRVGFSLFNSDSLEVLRAGAMNVIVSGNTTQERLGLFQTSSSFQLEGIFVSDPSTRTPLFLTLHDEALDIHDDKVYGHITNRQTPHHRLSSFSSEKDQRHSVEYIPASQMTDKKIQEFTHASSDISSLPSRLNDYERYFKDKSKNIGTCDKFWDVRDVTDNTFDIKYWSYPIPSIIFETSSVCEIHWQKDCIQQVLTTIHGLRELVEKSLNTQIQELHDDLLQSTSQETDFILSKEAFDTIEQTFIYIKNMITTYVPTPEAVMTTPLNTPRPDPNVSTNTSEVTNGLNTDGSLPEFGVSPLIESFCCNIKLRTASIRFWQSSSPLGHSSLIDVSLTYKQYLSHDAELQMSIKGIEVYLEKQCILSSNKQLNADNTLHTIKEEHLENVLVTRIRFYKSNNPVTQQPFPYNACLSGTLSQLTYTYFQKDLNTLLTYLSDGILDVILWRSYEAAYHLASSSYFLFIFRIDCPIFILPENKSCIPQLLDTLQTKAHHSTHDINDQQFLVPPLGCHMIVDCGLLTVRNAYTTRPIALPRHHQPVDDRTKDSSSFLDTTITSTVYIHLEGLSAKMKFSNYYEFFSSDVEGPVLEQVSGHAKLRGGDPVLIDIHLSQVSMKWNREQLTLLLDILNENISGLSYYPIAVDVSHHTTQSIKDLSETDDSVLYLKDKTLCPNNVSQTCYRTEDDLNQTIYTLFNQLPLRISTRISLDAIEITGSFRSTEALFELYADNLFIACDVSLYRFYMTYQFKLLGESIVLDDLRNTSQNVYKRFLECLPQQHDLSNHNKVIYPSATNTSSYGICVSPNDLFHLNYARPPTYCKGEEPPGTFLIWMRPGIDIRCLDTDVVGITTQHNIASKRIYCNGFEPSISISLESSVIGSIFSVELADPIVYVFTIGMQDILDWVLSAFNFSTMRRFPKPIPPVMTTSHSQDPTHYHTLKMDSQLQSRLSILIPQIKPFDINVLIKRGVFNIFSQLHNPKEPIIQWQNNFKLTAESIGNCFFFKTLQITDCSIKRVDIRPTDVTLYQTNRDIHDTQFKIKSKCVELCRPLFQYVSYVLICETFDLTATGVIETLFDPTIKQYYPSVGLPKETHLFNGIYLNFPGTSSSKQHERTFHTDILPPNQTDCLRHPYITISQFQMDIRIPEFNLNVSSRDLAVLLAASRSFNSDLPSISPGISPPPIIPALGLSTQSGTSCQDVMNDTLSTDYFSLPYNEVSEKDRVVEETSPLYSKQNRLHIDSTPRNHEHPLKDTAINFYRYCRFGFQFAGIHLTILDDLHTTISPIIQTHLSIDNISMYMNPKIFFLSLIGAKIQMDYMSQRVGEWEPFIEQLNIACTYKSYNQVSQLPSLSRHNEETVLNESSQHHTTSIPQTINSPQKYHDSNQSSLSPTRGLQRSNRYSAIPKLGIEWHGFLPEHIIYLLSTSPLLINITPQLCHLMTCFVTTLMGYLTATSLANNDMSLTTQLDISTLSSPKRSPHKRQSYISLNSLGVGNSNFNAENDSFLDHADNASYRFINLTGHTYLAFSLQHFSHTQDTTLLGLDYSDTEKPPEIGSMIRLIPTTTTLSADVLSEGISHTNDQKRSLNKMKLYIFLSAEPSPNILNRLCMLFPSISREFILRNILVTNDEEKTLDVLLGLSKLQQYEKKEDNEEETLLMDPSPPYMGCLPKNMEVTTMTLSCTNSVLLPLPCRELHRQQLKEDLSETFHYSPGRSFTQKQTDLHIQTTLTTESSFIESTISDDSSDELFQIERSSGHTQHASTFNTLASMPEQQEYSKLLQLSTPLESMNHTIGIVLSPRPFYKLLLLTTTVHIQNYSGFPLEIAFLNQNHHPLYLSNTRYRCAPCSLLHQDHHVSSSLTKTISYPNLFTTNHLCLNQPITQRQSSYPQLHTLPSTFLQKHSSQGHSGYSILLPEDNFLSVPQTAFIDSLRALIVFRPAVFGIDSQCEKISSPTQHVSPFQINLANGWSQLIDSSDSSRGSAGKPYIRSCQLLTNHRPHTLCTSQTSLNNQINVLSVLSKTPSQKTSSEKLFFTITRTKTITPLPAEQPMVSLSIYPSTTIVNACPTPIDVLLISESKIQTIDSKNKRTIPSPSFFSTFQSPINTIDTVQSDPIKLTLIPFTIFHIYNIPPVISGTSLNIRIRLNLIGKSDWSQEIKFSYPRPKDDVLSRLQLPCSHLSELEIEIYKDPHDFCSYVPSIHKHQQAYLLSCPRWLIDRTGLHLRASPVGISNHGIFPTFDGIALLGDSQDPTIELIIPDTQLVSSPSLKQPSLLSSKRCLAEIPSVGTFCDTSYDTGIKYYTFCLQSYRVNPTDTGGAVSRCITIMPKYLLTNGLQLMDIYIRQAQTHNSLLSLKPGETAPLYWTVCSEQLLFEFKPGESAGYAWSGPIFPCEEYVGGNNIAIMNGTTGISEIFYIQIIPQNGVFSITIQLIHDYPKAQTTSCIVTNHLNNKTIGLKTYHQDIPSDTTIASRYGIQSNISHHVNSRSHSHFFKDVKKPSFSPSNIKLQQSNHFLTLPSSELDISFIAEPTESIIIAWPYPFTQRILTCDLQLLTSNRTPLCAPTSFLVNSRWKTKRILHIHDDSSSSIRFVIIIQLKGNQLFIDVQESSDLRISPMKRRIPRPLLRYNNTITHQSIQDVIIAVIDPPKPAIQFIFNLSQIGISLVSDRRREELLFAEVSVVCGVFLQHEDNQLFECCIGDIQMDSQLEESDKPVLLANRGTHNSSHLHNRLSSNHRSVDLCDLLPCIGLFMDPGPIISTKQSLGDSYWDITDTSTDMTSCVSERDLSFSESISSPKLSSHQPSSFYQHRPTTKSKRKQINQNPVFFYMWIERESVSSSDLHLRRVFISLDDLEIDIDADMLNGLQHFAKECFDIFGCYQTTGITRDLIRHWIIVPPEINFIPPMPGQIIIIDEMRIRKFTIIVWCSFLLDKVTFLSDFLKMGLRILMVSQSLELKGAPITFETELVNSTIRGSLSTLIMMLKGRYMNQIINSIGVVLGYSSLANIPRAPLNLVRGTVGLGLTVADNFSSGIGTILSNLTFDTEYINKRQKDRLENARTNMSIKDGIHSATKDLKEGFKSLGDIVTKPIGGAQKDGFSGLLKGFGKGFVGTLIKPVDKLGQAVSNVATGLRAEYVTRPLGGYKCRTMRRRKPRMLWGPMGRICPYNSTEADLRESLALKRAKDVLQSITVSLREVDPPEHLVLLVYPKRICFVDLYAGRGRLNIHDSHQSGGQSSTDFNLSYSNNSTSQSPSHDTVIGRARLIWQVDLTQITNVRASSHGVSIHTSRHVCQIPCHQGHTIKKLYEEIMKAERRVKAIVQIGKVTDWIGIYANHMF